MADAATRSVLIVDDDPAIRLVLDTLFTDEGYTTGTAGDGVEALEQMAARKYDLLLTDLTMPHMDGHGLIEAVIRDHKDVVVVAMTAQPSVEAISSTFDGGVHAFLVKPFPSLDDVLRKVDRAFRTWSLKARIAGNVSQVNKMLGEQ